MLPDFRRSRFFALILLGAAVGPVLPARAADPPPERVSWRGDFEVGLEEAVVLRRPLVVTFYTNWCGWCRKLEATTFRSPDFVAAARNVVPVRVNAEEERGVAAMFQVRSYPTTVVLSRRGQELGRIVGYQPPEAFVQSLYAALGRREDYDEVVATAEEKPRDPEAQYFLGDMFLALGRYPEARAAFDRVLELDTTNVSELADDAYLDRSLAVYLAGFPEQAATQLDEFVARYPSSDRADQGLFFYGMFLMETGKEELGRAKLKEAATRTRLEYIRSQATRLAGGE